MISTFSTCSNKQHSQGNKFSGGKIFDFPIQSTSTKTFCVGSQNFFRLDFS